MSKQLFDFFGALALLVLTAPFFPLIALWIKATSPGPVIFRQVRVGYHGAPFIILKFRTLRDKSGLSLDRVLRGDTRLTKPGSFLRKTHMDELPQLINVLTGHMSLVGPRPKPFDEMKKNIREIPEYAQRFHVRPGLTGLVQLHGREWFIKRSTRSALRLDLFYIKHQSVCFDLKILCKTVMVVLRCKGV